jgi:hypothetical protein
LSDIWALMVLRQSMIDAMDSSAVSADIGNELFRPADSAAFQANPSLLGGCLPLKIVPLERGFDRHDYSAARVTHGLGPFLRLEPSQGWRPPGASTAIRPSRVVGRLAPIATLVLIFSDSELSYWASIARLPKEKNRRQPPFWTRRDS